MTIKYFADLVLGLMSGAVTKQRKVNMKYIGVLPHSRISLEISTRKTTNERNIIINIINTTLHSKSQYRWYQKQQKDLVAIGQDIIGLGQVKTL